MENNQNKNLVLIEDLGMLYPNLTSKRKKRYGLYKCFCGNEFRTRVENVKNRNTKSCGCINGTKHNLTNHRLYQTWNGMIQRCNNKNSKNYKHYGARGINVCDEWLNVQSFINDMYPSYKEGLSIDRIDNNKGYSKDNCRWSDKSTQVRNTRRIQSNSTTGYRGVSVLKNKNIYKTSISVNNKRIHLGYFTDKIEAAKAYDQYVINNNLKHTRNFT